MPKLRLCGCSSSSLQLQRAPQVSVPLPLFSGRSPQKSENSAMPREESLLKKITQLKKYEKQKERARCYYRLSSGCFLLSAIAVTGFVSTIILTATLLTNPVLPLVILSFAIGFAIFFILGSFFSACAEESYNNTENDKKIEALRENLDRSFFEKEEKERESRHSLSLSLLPPPSSSSTFIRNNTYRIQQDAVPPQSE